MEISQLALKRLFHRSGIRRISNGSYDKLYLHINEQVKNILEKSMTLIKNRQKNVLNNEDIRKGFILNNILNIISKSSIQNGGEYIGYCDNEPSQCGDIVNQKGGIDFCDGQISQCGNYSEDITLSCANKQNGGGGGDYFFSIPSSQFNRLVTKLLEENNNQKITKSAVNHLQYLIETSVVDQLIKKNVENNKVFNLE
jgi:histone H3/H4